MHAWTLRKRLVAGFALLIATASIVAGIALNVMREASAEVSTVSHEYLPEVALSAAFEREILNARILFIYHVLIQKPGALEGGWKRFNNAKALIPQLRNQIAVSPKLKHLAPETEELDTDIQKYEQVLNQILEIVAKGENHGPAFTQIVKDWAAIGLKLVTAAGTLNHEASVAAKDSTALYAEKLGHYVEITAAGCVGIVGIGLVVAWVITRKINRELSANATELKELSSGILQASYNLAESSSSLARGASDQATSIEQTSVSCQQISSAANRNTGVAQRMAQNMTESQAKSQKSSQALENMKTAMDAIGASGKKMSEIIKLIDEVASQTSLLGLNASVEAARAGEAGMGFAVVADEVRALAQRSAQAAKDTAHLIEDSKTKTAAGLQQVRVVVESIQGIFADSVKAKEYADEVTSGLSEQTAGVAQVADSIQRLQQVTQTTAKSAENTGTAAQQLSAQAQHLQRISKGLLSLVGS